MRIELVDDLDGSDATTTVSFSYKGATYEIDLSDKNLAAMDRAMEKYLVHATRLRGGPRKPRTGPSPAQVREWAATQGIEVPKMGKVPGPILAQFIAAH